MNTNLTIKNFRVFDEEGVTIELTPITILTGCNSSGKSSIVKAVLFLNDFLSQIKKDYDNDEPITLEKYKIDFSKYPINLLGRFDKVVHKGSSKREVIIAYTTYSRMLSKDVDVEFVFSASENDMLNNAYLKKMTLSADDGVFYSYSRQKGAKINLYMLKDTCLDFISLEHFIYQICVSTYSYESKEEKLRQEKSLFSFLDGVGRIRSRIKDVAEYVRFFADDDKSVISKCIPNTQNRQNESDWELETKIIEWTRHNGSLFYIPLVEELDKYSKEEIEEYVNQNILKEEQGFDFANSALKKIVKDFVQSKSDKFSMYFREYETKFLKNVRSFGVDAPDIYQLHYKDYIERGESQKITFEYLYEILMYWSSHLKLKEDFRSYYNKEIWYLEFIDVHYMYQLLTSYFSDLIKEILIPEWIDVEYVSSSRTTIKRLYGLDANDDFTRLLKKYLEKRRNILDRLKKIENQKDELFRKIHEIEKKELLASMEFMNNWVKKFDLGESIMLEPLDKEGLGVVIRLKKTAEGEGNLLADEGYGITQLFSVLLQIQTAVLSKYKKSQWSKFDVFEEILKSSDLQLHDIQYVQQIIAIEEPEIHLHPKFQSLLADMFLEAYEKYNIHFIVETHSEYLIRKLQVMVADNGNALSPNDVSLNYVEKGNDGLSTNRKIGIKRDGGLMDSFGEGFFDEAGSLSRQLLKLSL